MSFPLRVLPEVPSTNDVALSLLRAEPGALHPLGGVPAIAVRAERQTAGRGRAGRAWASPAGAGLYLSIAIAPAWTPRQAAWLTVAAGLAVRAACVAGGATAPDLKWPNDLLVPDGSGRKLGGILVETRTRGGVVDAAVIGIGVNLLAPPPEIATIAGSLADIGAAPDADTFAARVLDALAPELAALDGDAERAAASLVRRARDASSLWGRTVRFERAGAVATGVARTWAEDGGLEIALADGGTTVVHAGDVAVTWIAP